jgi:hypothetical protein
MSTESQNCEVSREQPFLGNGSERMLHKGYYLKGSVGKKSLVVALKGLDGKMNRLAVNHQS